MPTTSESRTIAAPQRAVILSGVNARLGHNDSREGIWGGAPPSLSQANYRQTLTPSASPSLRPARLSMTR